ncbi:MAG: hypothetical protein HOP15_06565 [Planctomycetes bacterium]|nr:hypothetical protein [Planctomycetota bacterium]
MPSIADLLPPHGLPAPFGALADETAHRADGRRDWQRGVARAKRARGPEAW